ncbi:Acyl-CoA N-acyltransferase [Penicillium odoratum]|uniref:Acyl-CoA N-acyltransferase n=1 Tax=Penicillium odoratum TaxID=1167516 RepID=UPI002547EEC3|nr:Acyl-CoA N-acyltransferase [Penicillium odoratum]KAJ5761088.1 Acyl-CoA N-acyltransferase [Penicillium odoratum]
MASKFTYSFFRISKETGISESAQKIRELRLKALQTSPGSFSSTYAIEAAFTDADWINLINLPDREFFICAAKPVNQDPSSPDDPQWIGQVTVRGPGSAAAFDLPDEACQPPQQSDDVEERWQLLSLFNLPEHRGHGIGSKLCKKVIEYLQSYRTYPSTVKIRLIIKRGNDAALEFYKRLGFEQAGSATLVEALIANGDEHLIPKDGPPQIYTDRQGMIMLLCLPRIRDVQSN